MVEDEESCGQATGSYIAKETYKDKIYNNSEIIMAGNNWSLVQLAIVNASINQVVAGANRITNGNGISWVKKNLGGTVFDLGGGLSGLLEINYVTHNVVHLSNNFDNLGDPRIKWNSINFLEHTMIIHELGHILDNRTSNSPFGDATWFGGGASDGLLNFVGAKPTAPLRFLKGLSLPRQNMFDNRDGFGYGNNSAADYWAHTFTATIVVPDSPYAPQMAKLWMAAFIDLTK